MPMIGPLPPRVLDRRPFTPSMLAERWQCSERHIRNLIASGDLRAFKVGDKLVRIAMDVIEEFERRSFSEPDGEAARQDARQAANRSARKVRLLRK